MNGVSLGSYSHDINEVDAWVDGNPNPDYKGSFSIDLSCDESCNCDVVKSDLQCYMYAVLDFEDIPNSVDGYHSDSFAVTKLGDSNNCEMNNAETDWGCIHSGTAAFSSFPYYDDYYTYRNHEEAIIKDVADGVFTFDVQHNFHNDEDYYKYSDCAVDHINRGTLYIFVNDIYKASFRHASNDKIDTHVDGEPNPKYKGQYKVTATCDSSCQCTFVKE